MTRTMAPGSNRSISPMVLINFYECEVVVEYQKRNKLGLVLI